MCLSEDKDQVNVKTLVLNLDTFYGYGLKLTLTPVIVVTVLFPIVTIKLNFFFPQNVAMNLHYIYMKNCPL